MQSVLLVSDVAEMLKVSPSSVRRWCVEARKGNGSFPLPISARGGKGRWLRSDIETFLASQSTATPQPAPARKRRSGAKAFQSRQEATDKALERYRQNRKVGCGGEQ